MTNSARCSAGVGIFALQRGEDVKRPRTADSTILYTRRQRGSPTLITNPIIATEDSAAMVNTADAYTSNPRSEDGDPDPNRGCHFS
jgi:hypothetical protein